jgi:hypothetical protein
MSRPQQPEIRRSQHNEVDETNHAKEVADTTLGGDGGSGPVPEANQAGHRPERGQDKPDPEAFRKRLSGDDA